MMMMIETECFKGAVVVVVRSSVCLVCQCLCWWPAGYVLMKTLWLVGWLVWFGSSRFSSAPIASRCPDVVHRISRSASGYRMDRMREGI